MTATIFADTGRPDHHAARPPLRPRDGSASLVARRSRRSDRYLQCAVHDLSRWRGLFRRKRPCVPATVRRPSWPRRSRRFTTQEAIHSREHDAFNQRATDSRLRSDRCWRRRSRKRLAMTKGRPPIVSLAATMALEHFTAILAHQLLANPRHLAGAEQARRRTCGGGMPSKRSSIRASLTTPGSTPPATGRGGSGGR